MLENDIYAANYDLDFGLRGERGSRQTRERKRSIIELYIERIYVGATIFQKGVVIVKNVKASLLKFPLPPSLSFSPRPPFSRAAQFASRSLFNDLADDRLCPVYLRAVLVYLYGPIGFENESGDQEVVAVNETIKL